eukprot:TRINITY_DN506_c0_g1_i1.p1 TRINITY_DN506_c0_g1~~TRINITY_DN506_c0_g1_i1.p1  ORF type:complete len:476 (+),score=206.26 TRINITY_DN506_c0_g1_i1:77-1504(+)
MDFLMIIRFFNDNNAKPLPAIPPNPSSMDNNNFFNNDNSFQQPPMNNNFFQPQEQSPMDNNFFQPQEQPQSPMNNGFFNENNDPKPLPVIPPISSPNNNYSPPQITQIQHFKNPNSSPALQNMAFQNNSISSSPPVNANASNNEFFNNNDLVGGPPPISRNSKPDLSPMNNNVDNNNFFNDGNSNNFFNDGNENPVMLESSQIDPNLNSQVPNWLQAQLVIEGNDDQIDDLNINGIELKYRDSVYWDTQEIENRNKDLKEISTEMIALNECFQDLAVEAEVQTEQIEIAEEQAEIALKHQQEGMKLLQKSAKAASAVTLPVGCGAIGAVAGGVTGGLIGGVAIGGAAVPGVVIGTAVGGVIGTGVGVGTTAVIALAGDKQMHKARLNHQWQPDKYAKNCNLCNKKFTQITRKHHCRNCGFIFCNKCCKHKMNLPGVSSILKPKVCNKCFEALMYHRGLSDKCNVVKMEKPLPTPP